MLGSVRLYASAGVLYSGFIQLEEAQRRASPAAPRDSRSMRAGVPAVGCMPLLGCGVPALFDDQFRHVLIFILLDQDADYFHQRSERM